MFNYLTPNKMKNLETAAKVKTSLTIIKDLGWAVLIKKDRSNKLWAVEKLDNGLFGGCAPYPSF